MGRLSESKESLAVLEELLRRRICSVCVDRNAGGGCGLSNPAECGLFNRFPRIVESISRVQSENLEDYVAAIREDVCEGCVNQKLDGYCRVREEVRCVLDRYLVLIVGALEEARGPTLYHGMVLGRS